MRNIILCGQFLDFSGYAWAGRSYAKLFSNYFVNDRLFFVNDSLESHTKNIPEIELDKLKENFGISDIEFTPIEELENLSGEVYYFECLIPSTYLGKKYSNQLFPIDILDQNKSINLIKISMVAWESSVFSTLYASGIQVAGFDALLLHTRNHAEKLQAQIDLPVYINHYPVLELFNPQPQNTKSAADKFNILAFSAWNPRKGWDQLISAYYSEFFDCDDVSLTIKTHGDQDEIISAIKKIKKDTTKFLVKVENNSKIQSSQSPPKCEVRIDLSQLSEKDIQGYFSNFDLFASATKGEGFGLTIAQAGIAALPVLVPNQGGHTDFCPQWAYQVDSFTAACTNIGNPQIYDNSNMDLYQCDHLSLKKNLRKAYDDWKKGTITDKGNKTRKHMLEHLSSEKSIDKIKNIMKELQ